MQPFIPSGGGPPTWTLARCFNADLQEPAHARINRTVPLGPLPLEIITLREAPAAFGRIAGTTTRWDALFGESAPDLLEGVLEDRTFGSLALFQVTEMLVEAADIWPVRVVSERSSGGNVVLGLQVRQDDVLDRLSTALDLQPPAIRLARLVESDQLGVDGEWRLTEEPVLGLRGGDKTRWRLIDSDVKMRPPRFTVEGAGPSPQGSDLYLRAGGDGEDRLLQRKLKALRSLREHGELLEMLASPRLRRRPTHDRWDLDRLAASLDRSKMSALREMWAVLPLYLLQGPPGVGKTKLVEELVAARMAPDGAERLLLTAQSHAAVDHLMEKVGKVLAARRSEDARENVLALRCRPRDHGSGTSPLDLPVRAATLAAEFAASPLAAELPAHIAGRVADLSRSLAGASDEEEEDPSERYRRTSPDRSFQSLLLRSSNLVFASTNAAELETLVEERAQFDWSIIEEAGKATGVDLLAPLLLSYRRLMIGDHRQLPPFNAERMEKLFAAPHRIGEALELGRHLVARAFGQAGIDEALEVVAKGDMEALVGGARAMMMMFETMIETEIKAPRKEGRLHMAAQLDQQHRMHPAIAELVSKAFYEGTLRTSEEAETRFSEETCPVSFGGSVLGDSPVTFVDMPFAHGEVGMSSPELEPRWKNYPEANACVEVLKRLRAVGAERPDVAVLTPYRQQRRVIDDRVALAARGEQLAELSRFGRRGDELCHTVDSFQGNEADVIVISLVRNNAHSGLKSLGFLSDRRRMNVLMSRAKWRLVLIGSLGFLKARFQDELPHDEDGKLAFLRTWLDAFDDLCGRKDADDRPLARVVPIADLLGDAA
nr:ATP-binding protein [Sphingomonas sp. Y57]